MQKRFQLNQLKLISVGKPGDSKVVCDDIESDSEYEYEYEEIEVEVDEDYEEKIVDKTGKVMISEGWCYCIYENESQCACVNDSTKNIV